MTITLTRTLTITINITIAIGISVSVAINAPQALASASSSHKSQGKWHSGEWHQKDNKALENTHPHSVPLLKNTYKPVFLSTCLRIGFCAL